MLYPHATTSPSRKRLERHVGLSRKPAPLVLAPLTLALVLAFSAGASAQPAPTQGAELDAVVVTGSPRERKVLDAPYAITVIGTEALRSSGPMVNLSESLGRVPGLVVNNRNNYAQDLQISSRGFGARAAFGVRGLRLYADGIPATMPDGQGQVAHFDLAGAQRIEVLRGPFSVLYGNSSGGVIALFSAPVTQRTMEVALDGGSFGLRQGRVSVAAPLGDGFELSGSFAKTELDGFRPQSEAQRALGNVRLAWSDEQDRVTLLASSQSQDALDPLGLTRAQFNADPRQTTSVATQFNTRKSIDQTQLGVNWQHRFTGQGPLASSQLSLYSGQRSVIQYQAIAAATQTPARHGGGLVDFDRQYEGADARLTWRWDTLDVVTGVNVERQSDARRGYENFTGTGAAQVLGVQGRLRRDEDNTATTKEAYVQAEWALAETVSATLGTRSGRVSMSTADKFLGNGDDSGSLAFSYTNPVAGLRWKLDPTTTLHASLARGFESPTLGELAYRPDGAAGFNTALKAQTSQQVEVGAKLRPSNAVSVDLTAFLIDTDNEIGVQTNSGGRSSFQNVGSTRRYGAELGTVWRIQSDLRAQAAVSWLSARYTDGFKTCAAVPCTTPTVAVAAGNRIVGTQKASAFAEIAWRATADGEGALEWRGLSSTAANDTNTEFAPRSSVFNIRWLQRIALDANGRIEVLGRIDNLFDKSYVGSVIVNDGNGRYYEPGAPRSALLSVRYLRNW